MLGNKVCICKHWISCYDGPHISERFQPFMGDPPPEPVQKYYFNSIIIFSMRLMADECGVGGRPSMFKYTACIDVVKVLGIKLKYEGVFQHVAENQTLWSFGWYRDINYHSRVLKNDQQ